MKKGNKTIATPSVGKVTRPLSWEQEWDMMSMDQLNAEAATIKADLMELDAPFSVLSGQCSEEEYSVVVDAIAFCGGNATLKGVVYSLKGERYDAHSRDAMEALFGKLKSRLNNAQHTPAYKKAVAKQGLTAAEISELKELNVVIAKCESYMSVVAAVNSRNGKFLDKTAALFKSYDSLSAKRYKLELYLTKRKAASGTLESKVLDLSSLEASPVKEPKGKGKHKNLTSGEVKITDHTKK